MLFRRLVLAFASVAFTAALVAQTDPLPSWNTGPARRALIDFVHTTTDPTNREFVAEAERIAVFDQDGTLWVEHPIYTQIAYALERVPTVVANTPALKDV